MKTSFKTAILASALVAGTAAAIGFYPQAPIQPPVSVVTPPVAQPIAQPIAQPKVEVVFVLDTTSSMSGMIDAAKNNIWSIASTMASAQPTPQMHVGLVAFRDRGDAYVTRVLDLSQDLDSMYATLMDFRAEGGGDGPESVNAALNDAVNSINWSTDSTSYKVIFLVGDAPPHTDYPNDVQYPDILRQASAKGIVVNCIQAGDGADTRKVWQQIASLNQGQYFQVAQSGNAVAVTTPFDDKLATLSRELDETRLFYGSADKRRMLDKKVDAAKKLHAASPATVQAKRAEFNASEAGAYNLFGDSELVEDVSAGRVDLDTLAPSQLPEPLQSMSKDEQTRRVQETAEKRKVLQKEIASIGAQRQQYIEKNISEEKVEGSLDGKIFETVKQQAAEKGLRYSSRPTL